MRFLPVQWHQSCEHLHPGRSFPKAQFSMTSDIVSVRTEGQNAEKKLCFMKYMCMCGQGLRVLALEALTCVY